jgi:putative spermidine/putrescine transport system permease protein
MRPALAKSLLGLLSLLIGLFLILPTLFVVPMSFNGSSSLGLPTKNWTTRWYTTVFTSSQWGEAAWTSVQVGILTVLLATSLGTLIAVALARGTFRGRGVLQALVLSPMIIPVVVVAIGTYMNFVKWGLTGSVLGLALAHTVLALPFVVVAVSAAARQLDQTYELAAASLGAPPRTVFRRITLPLLAPGVVAGALFAFVTSWDEVVVALFLSSPDVRTMPVLMWTQVRSQVSPELAAVGTLLVAVSMLSVVGLHLLRKDQNA